MQNQCNLNVRSKCILNALRIRKGWAFLSSSSTGGGGGGSTPSIKFDPDNQEI